MNRLNIFIDETGNFGSKQDSRYYGVSFVFHDSKNSVEKEIKTLKQKLNNIGFKGMVHMADLVNRRNDYVCLSLEKRRQIFWALFHFARKIDIKIKSIFIDKRYYSSKARCIKKLFVELEGFITSISILLQKYQKIVVYYDNGQKELGDIIKMIFKGYNNVIIKTKFDHKEKKLFQVADMLTFIDKLGFGHISYKKVVSKNRFFSDYEIRSILKDLKIKKL